MNRKKITSSCILVCAFVVILFNVIIKEVKEDKLKINENIMSENKDSSFVIKEENSLKIEDDSAVNNIENFIEMKSNDLEIVAVNKTEKKMRVKVKVLNVRNETVSTNDENIIGLLHEGDIVSVTGLCDNNWVEIIYNGTTGYTYGDYLEDIE